MIWHIRHFFRYFNIIFFLSSIVKKSIIKTKVKIDAHRTLFKTLDAHHSLRAHLSIFVLEIRIFSYNFWKKDKIFLSCKYPMTASWHSNKIRVLFAYLDYGIFRIFIAVVIVCPISTHSQQKEAQNIQFEKMPTFVNTHECVRTGHLGRILRSWIKARPIRSNRPGLYWDYNLNIHNIT